MPGPSSLISSTTDSCSASCQVRTSTTPRPRAESIACSALMIRLSSTCWSWWPSANTCGRPAASASITLMFEPRCSVRSERQCFAHHLIDVHHRACRLALAGEGEQVADDAGGALRFAEDGLQPAPDRIVQRRFLRQPLGPAQDGRERIVQFVGDAGNRLAERRHLLGLQQLLIDVAGLIVQLFSLADVAHQRFDAERAVRRASIGARGELDPDWGVVRAAQSQQVVGHRSVCRQAFDECDARLRVDEPRTIEWTDGRFGHLVRVPEDQLQMRIGGDGRGVLGTEGPDIHPFPDTFEQPRERRGASVHAAII